MRLPKSQGVRAAALGVIAAAIAFVVFRSGGSGKKTDPIDAVPKESFLVGTLDAEELRRSPIYEVVLGKGGVGGVSALSLGGLERACGFDPFSRIERLALAVPEKEGERDFGIIARVKVSQSELQTCKRRLDEERGSAPSSAKEPSAATKKRGDFVVIDGVRAGGANREKSGRLAYGRDNLLVVSTGEWFDSILATAEGERPSVHEAKEHTEIRTSLTSREGWRAPTLLVSAILPRALRDRIRGEMGDETAARDASRAVMAGVLGVRAIGLAVRAGGAGGHVDARIELRCDSPEACASVDKLIQKKRLDWSKDLAIRMVGFGPVIDSLVTKQDGDKLEVSASANADALAATLARVVKLKSRSSASDEIEPPLDRVPRPEPARPDETIRPRDGG